MKKYRTMVAILLVISANPALAYLDPGTGTSLLQYILAAIFGLSLMLKAYWAKIKKWIKLSFSCSRGRKKKDRIKSKKIR